MGELFGGVFLTIFISSSFASTVPVNDLKNGHFKVLQKHPGMKVCADKVLKENKFVGGSIYKKTGECVGLTHDAWELEHNDYKWAYVTKTYVEEIFQPPFKVEQDVLEWAIPVMLNPGARLDIFISMDIPSSANWNLKLELSPWHRPCFGQYNSSLIDIGYGKVKFTQKINEEKRQLSSMDWPVPQASKEVFKVSYLSQTGSTTIQVDDKNLKRIKDLNMIDKRYICVSSSRPERTRISVHRIEFTAK